ncbi:DUF3486 family protein [Solidesulfovibrio sp.]
MARQSSVKKLPTPIRKELDRLLADGAHTLDQVVAHLRQLGAPVSRSAVGRYSQEFEEVAAHIRESREVAAAFARELGEVPEGDMGRVLVEVVHRLVFKAGVAKLREGAIDAVDAARLAKAIKDLAAGSKISVDMEFKIREQVAAETAKKAAGEAEAVGREKGLSAETVEAIKSRILGIKRPSQAGA